jgi:hypothetical protein
MYRPTHSNLSSLRRAGSSLRNKRVIDQRHSRIQRTPSSLVARRIARSNRRIRKNVTLQLRTSPNRSRRANNEVHIARLRTVDQHNLGSSRGSEGGRDLEDELPGGDAPGIESKSACQGDGVGGEDIDA